MKQNQSENKYSIAWFKIAECVLRGEKERALGVYRLLAHSLPDTALASQLEADILLACLEFERAFKTYAKAAEQYEKDNRCVQALAVYEHMITMRPDDVIIRAKVTRMHAEQKNSDMVVHHAALLASALISQGTLAVAYETVANCTALIDPLLLIPVYEQFLQAKVASDSAEYKLCSSILYKIIDTVVQTDSKAQLQQLLARLQTSAWLDVARAYLTRHSS